MSGSPHDFAADAFHAGQLYRSCFRELTESCGFTPNEMFVLLFLYRNAPEQDTATVIAQAWNVSKPLVTRSVNGLQKRSTACATRTTAVWYTCTCLMKDTLPPKRSITAVKPLR